MTFMSIVFIALVTLLFVLKSYGDEITWQPIDNVEGYILHYYSSENAYAIDVKNTTRYNIDELNLPAGNYTFFITVYNNKRVESVPSNMLNVTVSGETIPFQPTPQPSVLTKEEKEVLLK